MAYYKLYTDRNENFTAEVSVKNASLKNSIARLIVESGGVNLVFNGTINNGTCTVPIKKLKGIMEEKDHGKMYLEIIVEDVYFKPWESEFEVETHTSMKVVVQEQKESSSKPVVEVIRVEDPTKPETQGHVVVTPNTGEVENLPAATSTPKPDILKPNVHGIEGPTPTIAETPKPKKKKIVEQKKLPMPIYPSDELVRICETVGLTRKALTKNVLHELLTEYFTENREFIKNRAAITRQFLKKIK